MGAERGRPTPGPHVLRSLLEGGLQHGGEVLGALERLNGNVDGGHALWRAGGTREDVRGGTLLEGDVVVMLQEEVGHHVGVGLGAGLADLLELVVGGDRAVHFLAVNGDDAIRVAALGAAAAVGVDGDSLAVVVVTVKPTLAKSVNSLPDGPVSVRQREYSASGSTDSMLSTVTP